MDAKNTDSGKENLFPRKIKNTWNFKSHAIIENYTISVVTFTLILSRDRPMLDQLGTSSDSYNNNNNIVYFMKLLDILYTFYRMQ